MTRRPAGEGTVPRGDGRRPVVSYAGRRAVLATKHNKLPLAAAGGGRCGGHGPGARH